MDYLNSKLSCHKWKDLYLHSLLSLPISPPACCVYMRTRRNGEIHIRWLVSFVSYRVISLRIIFGKISFLFNWICKAFSGGRESSRKMLFHPVLQQRGQTADNWSFCAFLPPFWTGTSSSCRRQLWRDAPTQQALLLGGFLSFKQQLWLKGQGESHAAWDGGTGADLGGSDSRKSN